MQRTVVWKRRTSDQLISFFLFMFEEKSNWEDHRCALTLLSWSLVILSCLNAPSLSRFTTGRHRSEKENYSNVFFEFTYTTSARHPLLTHSRSLSFVSAHFLVPLLASAMPRIARYTALIIESILCRQWVLVPWALWSRIHGTNAGWQASLRPRTPSPG